MNALKLKTPRKPEDCFDWLTEDEAAEHARQAYRLARCCCYPVEGEEFAPDMPGEPLRYRIWSNREAFEESVGEYFVGRINVAAHLAGLKGYKVLAQRQENYERNIGFASSYPEVSTTHTGAGQ